jgi:hypothetical protein
MSYRPKIKKDDKGREDYDDIKDSAADIFPRDPPPWCGQI